MSHFWKISKNNVPGHYSNNYGSISRTIIFGPTQEFGRSYSFALVRPSVRPSVRPDGFRSNHSIVFSDFWHQGSFLWFQKTDEAGFLKKKFFWPKMAKKV